MAIAGIPILKQISLEKIIQTIENEGGRVLNACLKLGVQEHTIYKLIDLYPELKAAVDNARKLHSERMQDNSEIGIEHIINLYKEKPDTALKAIMFYLNNKARHRGYGASSQALEHEQINGALAMIKAIKIASSPIPINSHPSPLPINESPTGRQKDESGEFIPVKNVKGKGKAKAKRRERKVLESKVKNLVVQVEEEGIYDETCARAEVTNSLKEVKGKVDMSVYREAGRKIRGG